MEEIMTDDKRTLELIERARNGSRVAFDELAAQITAPLLTSIRLGIGEGLRAKLDAEDVLQETLLRAFQSIKHFRWQGEESLRRWLEGIAANFLLHSGRTYGRKKELEIRRDPPASDPTPSRNERRNERFDRLKRSIDGLSPDYRTVIRLSRLEGLKIQEIAERMGRSPSAVKNLLLRAMKQLRESFGDTESLGLPDRNLAEEEGGGHGE
jgi:RNA polymerase sigma-70 factor (ECF subfamily)